MELFIIRVKFAFFCILAFQYSSPGGSTTAGEVCYLRLPCCISDFEVKFCSCDRLEKFVAKECSGMARIKNTERKQKKQKGVEEAKFITWLECWKPKPFIQKCNTIRHLELIHKKDKCKKT